MSGFEKGQIIMTRQFGQSIFETARLVACSRSAVARTYLESKGGKHKLPTGSSAARTPQCQMWKKVIMSGTNQQKGYGGKNGRSSKLPQG